MMPASSRPLLILLLALLVACEPTYGTLPPGGGGGSGAEAGGDDSATPDDTGEAPFAPGGTWAGVGVGFDHWCGLTDDGSLACDGFGAFGQTDPPPGVYVQVDSGLHHSCALREDGEAVCWGFDAFGALDAPEGPFVQVDAGGYHSCALREDGSMACWGGIRDGEGVAQDGTFTQVSGGEGHTCAIRASGEPHCWGLDNAGQASPPDGPLAIIRSGWTHSCGLRPDGRAVCWGEDTGGESTAPEGRFKDIAAGRWVSCGIREDDTLACWGRGAEGLEAPPDGTYDALALGSTFACARALEGDVRCWGELAETVPPLTRADVGFHVQGVAWDMALRDWSTPGLCLKAVDPVAFWRNEDIPAQGEGAVAGAGAFEITDVQPTSDEGVLFYMHDCAGVHDVVPATTGLLRSAYGDLASGETLGGQFGVSFDRATLDDWLTDLQRVGFRGNEFVDRGALFILVTDRDGFVEGARITCDGEPCPDTYYMDGDDSDGRFGRGSTPNTETDSRMDSGVLVTGSPMREYAVEHPTLTFPTFEMASRPGTIFVYQFVAE